MIKTITIGDKDVRLDNSIGWAFEYKDQFGRDIVPALMPLIAGTIKAVTAILDGAGIEDGKVDTAKLAEAMADADLSDAYMYFNQFEATEIIQITWALAKNADEDIPEPKRWLKQFENFPVDEIVPEVARLIIKGVVSSKNAKRLEKLIGQIKQIRPEAKAAE